MCSDTDTLGEAWAAGAIKSTATLQDLGYYKNASGQDIKLAELVVGLPPDTTLEDLLATILLRTAYDWEALPLQTFPLQDFSPDGATVDYSVSFTVTAAVRPGRRLGRRPPSAAGALRPRLDPAFGRARIAAGRADAPPRRERAHLGGDRDLARHDLHARLPGEARAQPRHRVGDGENRRHGRAAPLLRRTPQHRDHRARRAGERRPGNRADDPVRHALPRLHLERLGQGFLQGHGRSGRAADDAPQPPEGGRRSRGLRADDRPAAVPHSGAILPVSGDVPFDLEQRTQAITPEALADVPQAAVGQSVLDVSDNRGLADEEVAVVSPEGGTYTIQVSSFDGGFSNDPWMLRVERSPAIPLPATCTNPPATGGGVTKPMPVVPPTANTLYLFASKRFGDLYG